MLATHRQPSSANPPRFWPRQTGTLSTRYLHHGEKGGVIAKNGHDMKTQPDQAWNDAADAMLTDLRGRGLGNSEIARKMGRGKASIAHRCAKLIAAGKLPRRQSWRAWTTAEIRQAERLLRDGLSWKDTARRLNRTQGALYKIAQLHALQIPRGPYMPHERATVKRMASQGHPARAIAATLGRPVRGVRDFMQRQKIRRAAQQSD